jgi:hypothetical protein
MDATGMAESVTTPGLLVLAPATTIETGSVARLWGARAFVAEKSAAGALASVTRIEAGAAARLRGVEASTMVLVATKSATGALASAITDETGSAARI